MLKCNSTGLLLIVMLVAPAMAGAQTPAGYEARMAWWRDARFGLFIHWGLYSVAGGQWGQTRCGTIASWLQHEARIEPDQYATLRSGFTAARYDPAQWAALAKRAGMKYAVMTAKHHEGFCLFDSKLTDFDVMTTPAHRDVARQYADAFRAAGLKVGFYYSVIDWHDPNYPVKGDPFHPMRDNPAFQNQPRDFQKYLDYMDGQVHELLTHYGQIDVLWWDFSYNQMEGPTWRAKQLMAMCRKLQPNIIMNNRLYTDAHVMDKEYEHGDFATPEQHIPPNGMGGLDWETCMTINDTWGYKPHDLNYKSSLTLIRNLVDIASKGGNYLLNVGPRADGTIPQPLIERLEAIGDWMMVNGESIYGTTASPFSRALPWGRVTTGKTHDGVTKLYLHVFDWPMKREIHIPPLDNRIQSVTLLDGGQAIQYDTTGQGTTIQLPLQPRHEASTVLVMQVDGKPVTLIDRIAPDERGAYQLTARAASLHGATIQYPSGQGEDSIGFWTNPQDWTSWTLSVPKAGRYLVKVTYGCGSDGGGEYAVECGSATLTAQTQSTGGWFNRRTDDIGTIDLPAGKSVQLAVRIRKQPRSAVMDLKHIELVPQSNASP